MYQSKCLLRLSERIQLRSIRPATMDVCIYTLDMDPHLYEEDDVFKSYVALVIQLLHAIRQTIIHLGQPRTYTHSTDTHRKSHTGHEHPSRGRAFIKGPHALEWYVYATSNIIT